MPPFQVDLALRKEVGSLLTELQRQHPKCIHATSSVDWAGFASSVSAVRVQLLARLRQGALEIPVSPPDENMTMVIAYVVDLFRLAVRDMSCTGACNG